MYSALVIKELRESAGLVALAGLGVAYALAELTGTRLLPWQSSNLYYYPFIHDEWTYYLTFVAGGLAVALGLKQTAWELGQGTYFFLLHRPVRRPTVFGIKLTIGFAVTMLLSGAMLLAYIWWAAIPGHMRGPFYMSMTIPAWTRWIALPPVYFAAFLAGIRPGRWFGTRLLPLLAGIVASYLASLMPWVWAAALISAIASALLVVAIFHYVRHRDY